MPVDRRLLIAFEYCAEVSWRIKFYGSSYGAGAAVEREFKCARGAPKAYYDLYRKNGTLESGRENCGRKGLLERDKTAADRIKAALEKRDEKTGKHIGKYFTYKEIGEEIGASTSATYRACVKLGIVAYVEYIIPRQNPQRKVKLLAWAKRQLNDKDKNGIPCLENDLRGWHDEKWFYCTYRRRKCK